MTLIVAPVGALTLANDNDTVVITTAGTVYNGAGIALDTNDHTGIAIINYGGIVSSTDVGLNFTDGSTGSIVNQASGYIVGSRGVEMHATDASLLNFGSITGFGTSTGDAGVYLAAASQDDLVDNRGSIYGEQYGVRDFSGHGGNTITNYGTIEGKTAAISIDTVAGKLTHINNYGTIKGGTFAAIDNHNVGTVDLVNHGTIFGTVALESSSALDGDTVYNAGTMDNVSLGAGNDLFDGTGGKSGTVFGEAGADTLVGGSQADFLIGGADGDRLVGRGGNDTLTGGTAADHFVFDTAFFVAGVDSITDFQHGVDKIELSHAIFSKTNAAGTLVGGQFFAGTQAHDANDHIIYNANNGWLIYDSNGSAAGGAHHFATIGAHLTLSASDFFIA